MIHIENINYSYTKKQPKVFSDFSLNFERGKIYGLLGKNGTGKSTLLYLLCGLLHPQSGKITVLGDDISKRNPNTLKDIYIVPEHIETPNRTIKQYAKELSPFYPNFDKEFLDFCIKEFEIEEEKPMNLMSMGQQKKAYISIALATRPKLLLMDEPSNGLDIPSKSQFRKVIASGVNEETTVIISTHQAHDIENLIDKIVVINDAKLLLNTNVETVNEKLSLKLIQYGQTSEGAIFSQSVMGGTAAIYSKNEDDKGTLPIDLETLFNAVLLEPKISNILKEENNENK